MSADALALAAQAAAAYANVRGPWVRPGTLLIESDPLSRGLLVRESHPAKAREALLFDPLSTKEMPPMPEPKDQGHWTHAICSRCWLKHWGSRRPTRLVEGEAEICCFCGADTDAGIYVRRDPKETPCQGGRGVPQALFR